MVGIQLPYGLKDGAQPVHISEVPTGLACGCSCPQCGKRLVAKKGRLVVHHFAHYATQAAQCTWATESALHRLAKDILAGEKAIWLPATPLLLPGTPRAKDEGWFPYETARLEERINDVRADLLLTNGTDAVMVEIAVSHFCNEAKIQKIEAAGVSAIEINLSGFDLFNSDLDLRSALLKEAPRTWLFHTNGYRKPIEAKEEPEPPPVVIRRPTLQATPRTYLSRTDEILAVARAKLRDPDKWLDTKHRDLGWRTPREAAATGLDHDIGFLDFLIQQASRDGH